MTIYAVTVLNECDWLGVNLFSSIDKVREYLTQWINEHEDLCDVTPEDVDLIAELERAREKIAKLKTAKLLSMCSHLFVIEKRVADKIEWEG